MSEHILSMALMKFHDDSVVAMSSIKFYLGITSCNTEHLLTHATSARAKSLHLSLRQYSKTFQTLKLIYPSSSYQRKGSLNSLLAEVAIGWKTWKTNIQRKTYHGSIPRQNGIHSCSTFSVHYATILISNWLQNHAVDDANESGRGIKSSQGSSQAQLGCHMAP